MYFVNVREDFETDIEDPRVTVYIWFLCNDHDGPRHFVEVGIGQHHPGQGPVANGDLFIPADVMARLQQGFGQWFEWRPVILNAALQDQVRQLPTPPSNYESTLRRVRVDHELYPRFEALIDTEERRQATATATSLPTPALTTPAIEADLENIRRELTEPHSQGSIYLIHMQGTTFYKIGMSLDPRIRLRTLQTGNPHQLYILNTQVVQDMRGAEIGLHRKFEAMRVPNPNAREWFDFGDCIDEVDAAFGILGR